VEKWRESRQPEMAQCLLENFAKAGFLGAQATASAEVHE
jgi:hypothetical protein